MHKIILLRHGQSDWNLENRFTGWTDVDLSATGIEEARRAGQVLLEAVFSLPVNGPAAVLGNAEPGLALAAGAAPEERTGAEGR